VPPIAVWHYMRKNSALLGLLALAAAPTYAQAPDTGEPLEEIVVTGEYPGPGMWKITRADDAAMHVLWIVGEPPPLPKRLQWKSKDVEAVALSAQEILRDASVTMDSDEKIGFFRGITLVPSLLKARHNPGDARLEDLLPPALYARWLTQKKLYLGRESGVESWRPIFAADKLRKAAFDDLKLRESGMVWDVIGQLVEKRKTRVNSPSLHFTFKRSEVRDKIKEFSRESLSDVECFSTTLDLTEALADTVTESRRARAWATADLETLAALPALPSPYLPCAMAVMNSQVAKEVIPPDIRQQLFALWIEAARKSLNDNQTTLAVVPLLKLTRDGGYLARLRELGYGIEAPK